MVFTKQTYFIVFLITLIGIRLINAQEGKKLEDQPSAGLPSLSTEVSVFKVPYPRGHEWYKRKTDHKPTWNQLVSSKKYKIIDPPRINPSMVPRSTPLPSNDRAKNGEEVKRSSIQLAQSLRRLGDVYFEEDNLAAAIKQYQLALDKVDIGNKEKLEIIYRLIVAYHASQQYAEVLNLCNNNPSLMQELMGDYKQDAQDCIDDSRQRIGRNDSSINIPG